MPKKQKLTGPCYKVQPRLEFYENKEAVRRRRWHWRIVISGDLVAVSTEGYSSKPNAVVNMLETGQHIAWIGNQINLMVLMRGI